MNNNWKQPPKYQLGQKVKYTVQTQDSVTKLTFTNQADCYVVSIRMDVMNKFSDYQQHTYIYGLSLTPYEESFDHIWESELNLMNT